MNKKPVSLIISFFLTYENVMRYKNVYACEVRMN